MITPKEIEKVTMTPEKRAMAQKDYFAFYIGRPISYLMTIPFLYTKITPNQVSIFSIIPAISGFVIMYVASSYLGYSLGWLGFFLWFLLDGVDGNIARYRKQFTKMGSVYDAMAGYIAMILAPFSWGIAASHHPGWLQNEIGLPADLYIVMGALSGIFVVFPRLMLHKALTTIGGDEKLTEVKDKEYYSFTKTLALNIISISSFMQVFMLIVIYLDAFDLFTVAYFLINGAVMMASLLSMFKNQ